MITGKACFVPFVVLIFSGIFATEGKSQMYECKTSFNVGLNYYKRGQFEEVEVTLTKCFRTLRRYKETIEKDVGSHDFIFKVYKLAIESYQELDEENLALDKTKELVDFFEAVFDESTVIIRLKKTVLTMVR